MSAGGGRYNHKKKKDRCILTLLCYLCMAQAWVQGTGTKSFGGGNPM